MILRQRNENNRTTLQTKNISTVNSTFFKLKNGKKPYINVEKTIQNSFNFTSVRHSKEKIKEN